MNNRHNHFGCDNQLNQTFTNVYTKSYPGPTYTVKYLGVVDGSMGILSRKMALQGTDQVKPLLTVDTTKAPEVTKQ